MPKIKRQNLPRNLMDHLADRVRLREISADDLIALRAWLDSNPEGPDTTARMSSRTPGHTVSLTAALSSAVNICNSRQFEKPFAPGDLRARDEQKTLWPKSDLTARNAASLSPATNYGPVTTFSVPPARPRSPCPKIRLEPPAIRWCQSLPRPLHPGSPPARPRSLVLQALSRRQSDNWRQSRRKKRVRC